MNRLTTLGKALVVFFTGLAIAAVVTLVSARSSSRESAGNAAAAFGGLSAQAQSTDTDDTASAASPLQVAFVVFAPSYGSSPRIIHVPQSGKRDSQAGANSANSDDEAVATIEQDDDVAPPRHRVIPLPRRGDAPAPQRRSAVPAPKRQADVAPNKAPNLAPMAPHRDATILQKLKAPQLGTNPPTQTAGEADAKLTPVYPTPSYDNTGSSATAPVPPPPVGYAPPSALPYRSN